MTKGSSVQRVLHERIDISRLPAELQKRVENHAGKDWKTSLDGIVEFREWLLTEQRFRCVYCQVAIHAISVGLCELDHILPKGPSFNCDPIKAHATDFKARYHTQGYSAFTFSVCNLAVSCKQCNASKQSFDPLGDRSVSPTQLPGIHTGYEWVHPHFAKYSECISINEHWLYSWLDKKGEYTIKACKLDKSEVLARRRTSDALASQSESLNNFLFKLIGKFDEIGHREIIKTLFDRFDLPEETASKILDIWSGAPREFTELERLCRETSALIGVPELSRKPILGLLTI